MGVLLLVRHGQASFGSGNYDQLSALGEIQADLLASRLAGIPGVRNLVSGTLIRQQKTAEAIAHACDLDVRTDAHWDEYDHVGIAGNRASDLIFHANDCMGGRERAELALDEAVRRWVAGEMVGAEAHVAFVERCSNALQSLTSSRGVTVIATSGGVISVISALLLGVSINSWPAFSRVTVNCGVTKIIAGRRGVSLVSFNDHSHLESDRALITYR